MKLEDFIKDVNNDLVAFEKNMKDLGYERRTSAKWAEILIAWMEWGSDWIKEECDSGYNCKYCDDLEDCAMGQRRLADDRNR